MDDGEGEVFLPFPEAKVEQVSRDYAAYTRANLSEEHGQVRTCQWQ